MMSPTMGNILLTIRYIDFVEGQDFLFFYSLFPFFMFFSILWAFLYFFFFLWSTRVFPSLLRIS